MQNQMDRLIARLTELRNSPDCKYAADSTAEAMIFAQSLGSIVGSELTAMVADLGGDTRPLANKGVCDETMHECFIDRAIHEKWKAA